MLKEKNLPQEYWGEAVNTITYVLNKATTKSLERVIPYEIWIGSKSNVNHSKVFHYIAYFLMLGGHCTKLEDKSKPKIFIRYEIRSKVYRYYDLVARRVYVNLSYGHVEEKALVSEQDESSR